MITITFNPQSPEQAALLGSVMAEYLRADPTKVRPIEGGQFPGQANEAESIGAVAGEAAAEAPKARRARKSTSAETPAADAPMQPTAEEAAETAAPEKTVAEPSPTAAPAAPAQPASTVAEVSLEQVRAKLAALSQGGKAAEVKSLISEFGVAKLTEIPSEKYGELLAKAEALA